MDFHRPQRGCSLSLSRARIKELNIHQYLFSATDSIYSVEGEKQNIFLTFGCLAVGQQ